MLPSALNDLPSLLPIPQTIKHNTHPSSPWYAKLLVLPSPTYEYQPGSSCDWLISELTCATPQAMYPLAPALSTCTQHRSGVGGERWRCG
jgi:hypothetical protein